MKNGSLVKVGGASAILVGVSLGMMRVSGIFGIEEFDTTEQKLLYIADHLTVYLTQQSFMLLTFLLVVPAALGLHWALRQAGSVTVIATVAVMAGALIGVGSALLNLSLKARLTPAYAEADAATRLTLEVVYQTFIGVGPSHAVAWFLLAGIGVGLFSFAILRTALLPKWIAWLGLFVALAGWLHLLTAVSDALWVLHEIKFDSFNLWTLAVGVALLRMREPVKVDAGE